MGLPGKRLLVIGVSVAAALATTACGTQRIGVPKSNAALYRGAVLFNQRCSGCHTLSYAATEGSAVNVRTAEYNNGPNFNIRCERPVTRVLYAIENGGFSGAIMPQNVVIGQQAIDVARFVATYAGRQAPKVPGSTPCSAKQVGTIPPMQSTASATATGTTTPSAGTTPTTTTAKPATAGKRTKSKRKR